MAHSLVQRVVGSSRPSGEGQHHPGAQEYSGSHHVLEIIIIIIMEICKAPILRLKALNKHNITHITYIEMENVTAI